MVEGPVASAADPARRHRVGYLVWSLLPVLIAVIFSFNDGRSRKQLAGLLVPVVLG